MSKKGKAKAPKAVDPDGEGSNRRDPRPVPARPKKSPAGARPKFGEDWDDPDFAHALDPGGEGDND